MSSKIEFVEKASKPKANISALCREYGISRQTGYKLLRRFKQRGYEGLEEESRRPKSTPLATAEEVVAAVLAGQRCPVLFPQVVNDNGGAQVHGAVDDDVNAHVIQGQGLAQYR